MVLLGDAAHTAHFSIGSGTKLAVEDALALAACLSEQPTLTDALEAYEAERRPVVASTQRAARASLEWFEDIALHLNQPPRQFAFNLLTRSRRVTHDNLRLRDPHFTEAVERGFGCPPGTPRCSPRSGCADSPCATASSSHPWTCTRRPTACPATSTSSTSAPARWAARPGDDGDGVREPGGPDHPGCAGLWSGRQAEAWRRITDFVHTRAPGTAIGVQLGHSGRKGSTRLMWEGMDEPLDEGNWPLVAPSPLPYKPGSQTPRELSRAQLTDLREQFTAAAVRAARAGFDLLELHCAHGCSRASSPR